MNIRGNVWWVGGGVGTGKSYEALQIAENFRTRKKSPKKTIILDWTNNPATYGHIPAIPIERLNYELPKQALVKVQTTNVPLFIEKCQKITNAVIIIDDATAKYKSNLPKEVEELCYKVKNNHLEIIFQFHTIRATAPALLDVVHMFVIKQTVDERLKDTCHSAHILEHLLNDVRAENRNYITGKKFATRLYDVTEEKICIKNLKAKSFAESYSKKIELFDYLDNKK